MVSSSFNGCIELPTRVHNKSINNIKQTAAKKKQKIIHFEIIDLTELNVHDLVKIIRNGFPMVTKLFA